MKKGKPLGRKNYGSIAHIEISRLGPGDHHITPGQEKIALERTRDWKDLVICQEKLDGSNVGIAKISGEIIPLTRSGYHALTSPYKMHYAFAQWVLEREGMFKELLKEQERLCGEWLLVAHGTRYKLEHSPFVAFDLMMGEVRMCYLDFEKYVSKWDIVTPELIHLGQPINLKRIKKNYPRNGMHGAQEEIEGFVWRVEREDRVDFLCKYVRQGKEDGKYFPEKNGGKLTYNEVPQQYRHLIDICEK